MKVYFTILKCRLAILFQYRVAFIAGLGTQFFWGIIKVMILTAFYGQATTSQPLSLAQVITFIWISQALLQLLPWDIDKEIEAQVKNGDVVYELARPLDLYWIWFFRAMAMRLVPPLFRGLPLFIIAILFFGLPFPPNWNLAVAFGASFILAALVSSAITTIVIISLFWTLSGEGIQRLLPHITLLLSGMTVPLPLFPDWMQLFLSLQPLRCIIDIPCRLYTGVIPADSAVYYLGLQVIWFLLLTIFGRWLMNKAVKNFVIQGG